MGFCSHEALKHSLPRDYKEFAFLMKASGNLAYFSFFNTELKQKPGLVQADTISTVKYEIIFSDIPNIGHWLSGPTPLGVQKAFEARIKKDGILDESEFIKPNYVKNPSVSVKKPSIDKS